METNRNTTEKGNFKIITVSWETIFTDVDNPDSLKTSELLWICHKVLQEKEVVWERVSKIVINFKDWNNWIVEYDEMLKWTFTTAKN